MQQQHILKTYIRGNNNQPRGIAVVVRDNEELKYGFSLCNTRLDRWDKKLGTSIALARATAPMYQLPEVQERESLVLDAFIRLEQRAKKYFKDLSPDAIKLSNHFDLSYEE
jgi:hypothetical protein